MIGDSLVVADQAAFDVFNALTLMDNVPVLQNLKASAIFSILAHHSDPLHTSLALVMDSSISTFITGGLPSSQE